MQGGPACLTCGFTVVSCRHCNRRRRPSACEANHLALMGNADPFVWKDAIKDCLTMYAIARRCVLCKPWTAVPTNTVRGVPGHTCLYKLLRFPGAWRRIRRRADAQERSHAVRGPLDFGHAWVVPSRQQRHPLAARQPRLQEQHERPALRSQRSTEHQRSVSAGTHQRASGVMGPRQ